MRCEYRFCERDGSCGRKGAAQNANGNVTGQMYEEDHPRPCDEHGKRQETQPPLGMKGAKSYGGGKGGRGVSRGEGRIDRAGKQQIFQVQFAGAKAIDHGL